MPWNLLGWLVPSHDPNVGDEDHPEQDHFPEALEILDVLEGGWSDHPSDHGGATYRGVTQATYDRWRLGKNLPLRSVRRMGDDERNAVYLDFFWGPSRAGRLSRRLALAQFDAAVHHGPRRAIKLLQKALSVTADGAWGPITEEAATSVINDREALDRYLERRKKFMRDIVDEDPGQAVFLQGWLNRVENLGRMIG